jgi:lipopolysaccharide/colanic/teichoic acid biosynthesis glycosyltransferase
MAEGVRYRLAGVGGTIIAVVLAVWLANAEPVQVTATSVVPVLSRLEPTVLPNGDFLISVSTATVVILVALFPMYKPRPRRILNVVYHVQRHVIIAGLALAAIGYFDYTYELPRATLLITVGILLVVLPTLFVTIRRAPSGDAERAIIVGDNPEEIDKILDVVDVPVLGYVSPPYRYSVSGREREAAVADGSGAVEGAKLSDLECFGGLSRLDEVLIEYDIDTAVFAFGETDRQEFFGALATCHEIGVAAKIHRDKADSVLVNGDPGSDIVDVDVEPWDWQDRIVKRVFDIGFSACGIVLLSPLIVSIAAAIKLEDRGSVLYSQQRTAEMGETFSVYKFRSMKPHSEDVKPGEEEDRITRVGQLLRTTHLDEVPQLWSILIGKMSVVGPRAAWTDEEHLLEREIGDWRRRWFVKPGLTGLAQVNGISSENPVAKLRYDIEYIRWQSFWYDMGIVIRQMWTVLTDLRELICDR